jgi:hypothetical protein
LQYALDKNFGNKYGPQLFFSYKEHVVLSSILKLSARGFKTGSDNVTLKKTQNLIKNKMGDWFIGPDYPNKANHL